MAKKRKSEKLAVGTQSFWDGRLSTFFGTLGLAILVLALFAGVGVGIAFGIGAFQADAKLPFFIGGIVAIVIFSLIGLCWASVLFTRWDINHTVVSGYRLQFNAGSASLFLNLIKWSVCILFTLGIYIFWVPIRIKKWKIANTTVIPEVDDCGFAPPEVNYYYDDYDD